MNHFHYRQNELFCEGSSLQDIAGTMGTPVYVYSHSALIENFQRVQNAFSPFNPLICYSLKANSNLNLCRILSSLGAGADVVSGGELYTALCAGFPPEKIVYAGVGKTPEEIEYALRKKIFLFNVESEEELEEIAKIAGRLGTKAPISLRINPDIDPETHRYITTGKKENKFGVSFDEAKKLYQEALRIETLEAKGIHIHIGSQITSIEPYLKALKKVKDFTQAVRGLGIELTYLDMGGGFGIGYKEKEQELPVGELAQQIASLVPDGMHLILEPGRYIVANTGVLVTKLLYRKEGTTKRFFIVDAGMNDLVRPSLYGAYHGIVPVKKVISHSPLKVSVVGPICESGDFFLHDAKLPPIGKGQLLCIMDSGAYGFSMSSNYNSRTKSAEVLVKKDTWWLVREREEYQDLIHRQRLPRVGVPATNSFSGSYFPIPFWKIEGTGNDFIIIDNRGEIITQRAQFARQVCPRKRGAGADGLILVEKAKGADFTMRIFNPDGSEAEMCGNGARCAVRFAYLKGIINRECGFQTLSGKIIATLDADKVKIKMIDPSDVQQIATLPIDGKMFQGYYINTGVPHFVMYVPCLEKTDVRGVGSKIRFHKLFQPQGTNVNFVTAKDGKVLVRTYERGVEDETLSCGTGVVASALISALTNKLSSPVTTCARGGELTVWFQFREGVFHNVFLEGAANTVYRGHLNGAQYA